MSEPPRPLPPKNEVALALLEGPSMFVHLDPRRPSVRVPPGFANRAELVLQLGLNMAIPIPDLKVDDAGVTCTLSFGGKPFWCKLPWEAVYALVGEDGKGMIWPGDVPPEISAQMQRAGAAPARAARKPRPRAVPDLGAAADSSDAEAAATPSTRDLAAAREARDAREPGSGRPRVVKRDREAEPPRAEAARAGAGGAHAKDPRSQDAKDASDDAVEPDEARPALGKKPRRELPPYLRVIK